MYFVEQSVGFKMHMVPSGTVEALAPKMTPETPENGKNGQNALKLEIGPLRFRCFSCIL